MEQEMTFEMKMEELEKIVSAIESGEKSLNEMVSLYERGTVLGQECMRMLEAYEGRLVLLKNGEAGE